MFILYLNPLKKDKNERFKRNKDRAQPPGGFRRRITDRNKYTYYASKARKDGFEQIAAIFEETANNEKEHAKLWFKLLHGGEIAKHNGQSQGCRRRRELRMDQHV